MKRRRLLAAGAGVGATLVAGCTGGDGDATDDPADDETEPRVEEYAEFEVADPPEDGGEEQQTDGNPALLDVDWSEYDRALTDPAADFETVLEADADLLEVDGSNAFQCARPPYADEATDGSRFVRTDADAAATLVYGPFDALAGLRVEAHYDFYSGEGETRYAFSSDGGESWTAFDPDYYVYDDQGGDWEAEEVGAAYLNTLHVHRGFPDGVTHVRVALAGGDEAWTPQLGRVECYE